MSKANFMGTLTDKNIKSLVLEGKLIIRDFEIDNVKQACYELRASNIYYDLADGNKKYELGQDEFILIKPKQLIVIITQETVELPDNIVGRIMTKGKLFSIGLLPINTYADPGFSGQLGIVFNNLSNNYIKIKPKEAIAKIEFSKLHENVDRRYNGQHGYQTKIWPVPDNMYLSNEEIRKDKRIKSTEEEIQLSYGAGLGNVVSRVFRFERHLIFAAVIYLFFSLLLIAVITFKGGSFIEPLVSVIFGVVSNIIFSILVYLATNLRRR